MAQTTDLTRKTNARKEFCTLILENNPAPSDAPKPNYESERGCFSRAQTSQTPYPAARSILRPATRSRWHCHRSWGQAGSARSPAPTGAVAVGGRLRDGAGQGAAAGLGWELGELLHVICKLDLLRDAKEEKRSVSRCSLQHVICSGYVAPGLP